MELILTLILAATTAPSPAPIVVTPSGVELEKLADNTMIPGTVGSFFFIETLLPEACGDRVLFNGFDERARLGLYSASAVGVQIVADTTVPVPGSAETFQDARKPVCVDGEVLFLGAGNATPSSNNPSAYGYRQGEIRTILQVGTPIGGNELSGIGELAANRRIVALNARLQPSSTTQAIVVKLGFGEPSIIADLSTVLPGQVAPVTIYSEPVAAGHDVVFRARTGLETGIYRWNESEGFSILADTATPIPALGGLTFSLFDQITSLDDGIVFGATHAGGTGIFISREGEVERLITPGDVTVDGEALVRARFPRGEGTLVAFDGATSSSGEVAFVRLHDGNIKRLLARGETLGGLPVDGVIVDADGESVALRVDHGTGSQAVYRASFPAPAAPTTEIPTLSRAGILLLALGLGLAGLWLLRRLPAGA